MRTMACIVSVASILAAGLAQAQESTPSPGQIELKNGLFGVSYRYEGRKLKGREVRELLARDSEAVRKYDQGKRYDGAGIVFACAGGALTGASGVFGGSTTETHSGLLAAGIALVVGSVVVAFAAEHSRTAAVDRYNHIVSGETRGSLHLLPPTRRGEWFSLAVRF